MNYFSNLIRRFWPGASQPKGEARMVIARSVRATESPDGIVLLQVDGGLVFTSNRVGARIWQGLVRREALSSIVADLSREYGLPADQMAADVTGFLRDLEQRRLVATTWSMA